MTEAYEPPPMTDSDQRIMISTELNVLLRLVAARHVNTSGLHDIRWRLNIEDVHCTGVLATLRAQLRYAIAERLSAASGMPVTYFVDGSAMPTVPDDLAGLE